MSSSFGHSFRVTTFGESHGGAVGCVIDGCPPGHQISLEVIQKDLARRKPGQSQLTTPRAEPDTVECLSGLEGGVSLGTPICLMVRNQDKRTGDYQDIQQVFRPSHGDFTYAEKYGQRSLGGGGRSSARETIGRVAASSVASQVVKNLCQGAEIVAWVESVKDIVAAEQDDQIVSRELVDASLVRCPDPAASRKMEELILKTKTAGDSVGGVIRCIMRGIPPGLGEPVFDKFEALLAHAMMSLPASKGFEIGEGFSSTKLFGSQHNDEFTLENGKVRTTTNRSGGIQGGISNGEIIYFRVAFKPVSTIFKSQRTVRADRSSETEFKPESGRHDPCVLPRAVPMIEAMAWLVFADLWLEQAARRACSK
jgi:chorismate synthase